MECWCCNSGEVSREFGKTLRAAGSTLFLLIAANWQLGILSGIGEPRGMRKRMGPLLLRTAFAIMLSFYTLTLSIMDLYSVLCLWAKQLRTRESSKLDNYFWTAAIIGTCPILIPLPPKWRSERQQLADTIGVTVASRLTDHLFPLHLSVSRKRSEQAAPSLETGAAQPYMVLSPFFLGSHSRRAREGLLHLKLVPDYEELRYLRSRSRFQNGITLLQVAGYMVGVAVRLGEHRINSPLEVIIGHLSIQVVLQLVMAAFACSHYQRPLRLRLSSQEFEEFLKELCEVTTSSAPTPWVNHCIMVAGLALTLFLLPAPLLYYAFVIHRRCHLCFYSTVLMALLPLLSFIILGTLVRRQQLELRSRTGGRVIDTWPPNSLGLPWFEEKLVLPLRLGLILIALLYSVSILLGGVATHKHWALFKLGTSDVLHDCILPHISST